MKPSGTIIIIFILLVSCMTTLDFSKKRFTVYEVENQKEIRRVYTVNIPKEYNDYKIISGHGKEHQFWYSDSLLLYFSTERNTPNNENIRNAGQWDEKFKHIIGLRESSDTLIFEGRNYRNNFWKELIIGEINIGYLNVPKEKKSVFDHAINSIGRR